MRSTLSGIVNCSSSDLMRLNLLPALHKFGPKRLGTTLTHDPQDSGPKSPLQARC